MCLHLLIIRFHVSALCNIPCACICRNFLNSVINNGLHVPRGVLHGVISFSIVKGKINQSVFQYLFICFSDLCLAFFPVFIYRNNVLVSLPAEIGGLNQLGTFDLHSNQVAQWAILFFWDLKSSLRDWLQTIKYIIFQHAPKHWWDFNCHISIIFCISGCPFFFPALIFGVANVYLIYSCS